MRSRRLPHALTHPEQGWSSLLLLLGLLVLLGVSIADSRPLELTDYGSLSASLPVVVVAAGLIGYLLARSSLGVVRAHLIGAAVAALMLLWFAGAAVLGQAPLPTGVEGISERVAAVWMQLDADIAALVAETITTSTVTVYLVLAALCWTTAQFGAFSVFRYDRGGPAVMAVGTILFLNIGLGSLQAQADLLPVVPVLAIFAGLALLLLMRLQLVQQRYAWARRHISDTGDVSRLFLRTGAAFVIIAVVSASSLTVWATVNAQDVSIEGLEEPFEDIAEHIEGWLAFIGSPTGDEIPPSLGTETELSDTWSPGNGIAFTAFVQGSLYGNYWWGKADNVYEPANGRWRTTPEGTLETIEANRQLQPPGEGDNRVRATITIGDSVYARRNLFRPPNANNSPTHALRARVAPGRGISDIEYLEALEEGATVGVLSFVRDYSPRNESLTGNALRDTEQTRYPDWAREHYLHGRFDEGIVGPRTREMADRIQGVPGSTPYDWAVQVQTELRKMEYNDDIKDRCDEYGGVYTECLLAIREGFCQQYATTMVMLMRAMGVPARFVTGYLPGELDESGYLTVEQEALHNWAEVYFPDDVGWVRFDPTPGRGLPTELRNGGPRTSPSTPEPTPDEGNFDEDIEQPLDTPEPEVPPVGDVPGSGGDNTGVIISLAGIVGLLVAVVSVLLLFRLRRLPDGDDSLAYRGIVSLATRLGFGPHPSQTEYEYARTLSETIPGVRDDLYVVTDAQVQTAYGGRHLDDTRRGLLRSAYSRIRTALLRLSLRRRR